MQAGLSRGRWARRIGVGLLALAVLVVMTLWFFLRGSLAQLDGRRTTAGLQGSVTVHRDALGIPSIAAADRADVAYATGFVHAQDRYFQMDLLRRVAAGELAELFGPKALPVDREHRLHRFRARAALAYAGLSDVDRQLLERYTAGVNQGLNALGTRPFEYGLLATAPRAWSPQDSLLVIWAMYFDLQGAGIRRELARGWLQRNTTAEQLAFLLPAATRWETPVDGTPVDVVPAAIPASAPAWWGQPGPHDAAPLAHVERESAIGSNIGSNNWAVAGRRSATGGAIVADDMHLGIKLPNTWYRTLLQVPDSNGSTRRIVGVTLPGTPFIVAGSNGHVAWGFTNSYGDYLDLVAVRGDAAHPGQVRLNGRWETPAVHRETILVKGAPAETLAVRETSLGPLLDAAGTTYAVHWIAHEPALLNVNLRRLEGANNVDDALAVASQAGMPAQNFVAGDAAGNIGWTIAGPLPRRAGPGPADSFPLAGVAGWQGRLDAAEYPRVVNPASGQLVTANSRQLSGSGAALLGDGGFDLGARARQASDGLAALGPKTDEQGVYRVMLDDRALFLQPWRDRAVTVLDAAALAADPQRAEAARLLQSAWTGHASVDASGYRIARGFMWSLHALLYGGADKQLKVYGQASVALADKRWPEVLARLLDEQPAGWLPPRYPDWRTLQLAALDRTIADLQADGKPLRDATWGAFNTAAIAHPIAGAVPALRRWLSAPADALPGDSHMPRVAGRAFGQSERLTVSPGREERAIFNMPGGQSGHPLSPYFLAGHADWVAGKPTPLLPGPVRHTLSFVP